MKCSNPACDREARAKGLCQRDYLRKWRRESFRILTAEDRFWAKVQRRSDGHWLWTGYRDSRGAGRFMTTDGGKRKIHLAHRYAWARMNGPLPPGYFLLRIPELCPEEACVRPAHRKPMRVSSFQAPGAGPVQSLQSPQ